MDKEQEAFLRELLNDFKIEAAEHYQSVVSGLLELEKNPPSAELLAGEGSRYQQIVETVFREVHSLKGAARAVNLADIERLCMSVEGIFHKLKKGEITLFPQLYDLLHKAMDTLKVMLGEVDHKEKKIHASALSRLLINLDAFQHGTGKKMPFRIQPPVSVPVNQDSINSEDYRTSFNDLPPAKFDGTEKSSVLFTEKQKKVLSDTEKESLTVRIATNKLYNLLRQAEEMISVKSTLAHYVKELQDTANQYSSWNRKLHDGNSKIYSLHLAELFTGVTGDAGTSEGSFNAELFSESQKSIIIHEKEFRKKHEEDIFNIGKNLDQLRHVTSRMIDELLLDMKSTLLYPFSSLLAIVPKIVRDLGREYDKEIALEIKGREIEIDRRILEEIKDPLIHLIRNCIDHGIETKSDRIRKGKNPEGILKIHITQESDGNIEMRVSDDGAGIDKQKVISSAIKAGIINPDTAHEMPDEDIYALIFRSGVSTSPFVTDISGRGLGMAIVAEKVEKLGGNINVESSLEGGSAFIITCPQTLSTFRGILTMASEQLFIIPTIAVQKAVRILPSDIKTVESRKTITFNGETVALISLTDILRLAVRRSKRNKEIHIPVIIISLLQKKIALAVDEVLGEHEGIVKNLGPQLSHVANIAGVTLLGNGRIVPILNIPELMESAVRSTVSVKSSFELDAETFTEAGKSSASADIKQKYVLVVEDSITVRSMLRNFIETAGFTVKTAVDGLEAYNFLQNEIFDIVVSDIEMPRMNGFELTVKIREDKSLSDMPVILVTALETADDLKRGMDAGANAYIVKSSFEKSNLIETIRRLI